MINVYCDDVLSIIYFYRGLVVKSIMQAQGVSQTFTHVFAALVAIINTKVYI